MIVRSGRGLALVLAVVAAGAVLAVALVERARAGGEVLSRSSASTSEIEPHLAVARNGEVAVAWMGVMDGAATHIGVRFSSDRGTTWSPVQRVDAPEGRLVADPVVVSDAAGTFYLTWLSFKANHRAGGEPHDMHVYAARAKAGSHHFGPAAEATSPSDAFRYDKPWAVVTANGALSIVYRHEAADKRGLTLATSQDGALFRRRVLTESAEFLGTLASVCTDDGSAPERGPPRNDRVWVVYVDPLAGVVLRDSEDPSPVSHAVSRAGENVALEGPTCLARGQEVIVAYGLASGGVDTGRSALLSSVHIARSNDGGRTFTEHADIREEGALLMHPALARGGGGDLDLVYLSGRGDGDAQASLRWRRIASLAALGTYTASRVVRAPLRLAARRDDPAWGGDYLGLARGGEILYAAFADNARGEPHVAFAAPGGAHD